VSCKRITTAQLVESLAASCSRPPPPGHLVPAAHNTTPNQGSNKLATSEQPAHKMKRAPAAGDNCCRLLAQPVFTHKQRRHTLNTEQQDPEQASTSGNRMLMRPTDKAPLALVVSSTCGTSSTCWHPVQQQWPMPTGRACTRHLEQRLLVCYKEKLCSIAPHGEPEQKERSTLQRRCRRTEHICTDALDGKDVW
jgi:hypothetical protein